MFNGYINYKWPFSIAMFVYQRVNLSYGKGFSCIPYEAASVVTVHNHPSNSKILAMAHQSSQISKVQFIVLVFPGRPRILVLVTHLWSGLNGAIYAGRIWRSQVIGPVIGDRQGVVKAFQAHIGEPVPWLPWGELLQMYIKGLISEM